MSICFQGSFAEGSQFARVPNLFVDPSCKHVFKGASGLIISGNILNMNTMCKIFNMDSQGTTPLLDIFLKHPVEEILPHLDGNITGIYYTPSTIILFRDKNGGGLPVYYSQTHFSNHIDGLRETLHSSLQPDLRSISFYLEHGYIPSPHTAFDGISKIPPGYYLACREGNCSLTNAFPFSDFTTSLGNLNISEHEAVDHYTQLHKNAIRRSIIGASEVGVLLSGGYDSGGNLARLRDIHQGKIKSFSVGFKGNPWSELPYSRLIARQYETDHYEYEIDGHEIEYLPEIVKGFTEPFQESGLMVNLCLMKLLVSKHPVPTTLCGEGNDQLFGTADRDLAFHFVSGKTGLSFLQKGFNAIFKNKPFLPENILFKFLYHNDKILNILNSDRFGFKPIEQRLLLQEPERTSADGSMYHNSFPFKGFNDLYLGKTYFIDLQQQTNEIIINKAACSSRVYGNSVAFPLLDMDIYRFITQLPISLRLHGSLCEILQGKGVSKYIYKESIKGKLPLQVVGRKKQGGFAPMILFFQNESRRKHIFDYIIRSDMTKSLLNKKMLEQYFNQFSCEIMDQKIWFWYYQFRCFQVFSLLILAIWWDQFINNKPFIKLSDFIGVKVT